MILWKERRALFPNASKWALSHLVGSWSEFSEPCTFWHGHSQANNKPRGNHTPSPPFKQKTCGQQSIGSQSWTWLTWLKRLSTHAHTLRCNFYRGHDLEHITMAKSWKQPECPSVDERVKRTWYIWCMCDVYMCICTECPSVGERVKRIWCIWCICDVYMCICTGMCVCVFSL